MDKKIWIFLFIFLIIGIGGFAFWKSSNKDVKNENNAYETNRTSTSTNTASINTNINTNSDSNSSLLTTEVQNKDEQNPAEGNSESAPSTAPKVIEEQIATFSTKIYTKDNARQNNIQITCGILNDSIVKAGATFSFTGTIGPASTDKGYQKADIFDSNGNKKKGLGGGNCQVSTTLYNAVLAVSSLVVTERHEHSNDVPYIQEGKDAAVAYGSYDLKFRNDTGHDVKIKTEANTSTVTVSLIALK